VQPRVQRLKDRPERLLTLLGVAAVEDKATQRTGRQFAWLWRACGGAAAVSVFGTILLSAGPLFYVALAVTLVFLILAIVFILRWRGKVQLDLDDRKLDTALKLLRILRADIPKGAAVALTLDPRMYKDGGTVVARTGSITKYRHPWLELSAPLADGNVVTLGLTDRVKRKDKVKRKRSVHLEWWRSDLDIGLRLAKRYGDASDAALRLRDRAAPPPLRVVTVTEQRTRARRTGRAGRLWARLRTPVRPPAAESDPAGLANGDTLLAALRWAYGSLAPARGRP